MTAQKNSDKVVAIIFFPTILFFVAMFSVMVFRVWSNAIALHNNSYEGQGTLLYYTKETAASGAKGGKFTVAHIEYIDKVGNKKIFQSSSYVDYYVGEKMRILIPKTNEGYPQDSRDSIWLGPIISSVSLLLFLVIGYLFVMNGRKKVPKVR